MADEPAPAPVDAPKPADAPAPSLASTPAPADTPADKPADAPADKPAPATIDPTKLVMPEGFKADEPTLKAATEILTDEKLDPQARMQKLVDFHAAELKKASETSSKYWGDLQKEWGDKAKEVYGPEPAKSPKIVSVGKLIDSLGEKPASDLRAALDMSGMGNHPAIIAAFVQLADRLGEPKHLQGNPPGRPQSAAAAMYPNMTKES